MNDNLPEVLAAYKAYEAKVDAQLGLAATEIGLRMEGLAKNQIKGSRPKGEKAVTGRPPMNRTGNLRRSIIGFSAREGFGTYAAIVGAQMIYARPVEVGEPYNPPTWRNGEHFPFLAPAVQQFLQTGQLQSIISKYMRMIK
jgi:hypothetical protein